MSQKIDDLEAVRVLITTLENFDKNEQERIIRWAREKLGLSANQITPSVTKISVGKPEVQQAHSTRKDLKTFVKEKNPNSDMQFAVAVAYYYKFESPENERKDSINSEVLQDAARLSNRERLQNPGQTLRNTSFNGMLDKTEERGFYKINTVGENLVAMTLPGDSSSVVRKKKTKKSNSKPKLKSKKTSKKK